jgi:peptide/histidine transporter 3/4
MDKAAAAGDKPENEHKAYAFAVVADDEDAMKKSHLDLSDDDAGGGENNYRGWKSMPYVIGPSSPAPAVELSRANPSSPYI